MIITDTEHSSAIGLLAKNPLVQMKIPLLGFSETSFGLLGTVSWAAQSKLKTMENVSFDLLETSGRAAALPRPRREVPGAEDHPKPGMTSARIGMIWTKSS